MTFAATSVSGGLPSIVGEAGANQDWRRDIPVKKESNFKNWVDSLPPSNNVEDRRADMPQEEIEGAYKEYSGRIDPIDEKDIRFDRSRDFDKYDNPALTELKKAGPRSRMIDPVPLPRPRPGGRKPMIYK